MNVDVRPAQNGRTCRGRASASAMNIGDPNLVSVVPEDVPAFNIRESKLLVKFTHNFYQYNSNIHSKTSFLHIHYKACKCYVKNMGMYMMKIN